MYSLKVTLKKHDSEITSNSLGKNDHSNFDLRILQSDLKVSFLGGGKTFTISQTCGALQFGSCAITFYIRIMRKKRLHTIIKQSCTSSEKSNNKNSS